jgi:hypothetical protein
VRLVAQTESDNQFWCYRRTVAGTRSLSRLLTDAKAGDDEAITRLVRRRPRHLGSEFVLKRLLEAKHILREVSKRRLLDRESQTTADRAEQFLQDLADAVRHVPDVRRKAIITDCHHLTQRLILARRVIVATPKSERLRKSTCERLAAQTRLETAVVRRFLENPRTGAKKVARELIGARYSISAERVRKLQEKYASRYDLRRSFIVVRAAPRKRT